MIAMQVHLQSFKMHRRRTYLVFALLFCVRFKQFKAEFCHEIIEKINQNLITLKSAKGVINNELLNEVSIVIFSWIKNSKEIF